MLRVNFGPVVVRRRANRRRKCPESTRTKVRKMKSRRDPRRRAKMRRGKTKGAPWTGTCTATYNTIIM